MARSREPIRFPFIVEGVKDAIRGFAKLDGEVEKFAATAERASKPIKDLPEDAQKSARETERAFRQLGVRSSRSFEQQRRSAQAAYDKIANSGEASAQDIEAAFNQLQSKLKRINDQAATQAETRWQKASKRIGNRLNDVGQSLSFRVSAPVALGLGAAVKQAADLEQTMFAVKAVVGNLTDDEFTALNDKAKEVGASTKFSATQAAEAIRILAANGLNTQEILGGALDATIQTSAATGAELALIADLVTDVGAQFQLSADKLPGISNQIVGAMSASKFAADDFAFAFSQGGAVAAAAGVELEDFIASIAATSSAFSSGADAGTSFKTFIQRLGAPSKQAADQMRQLGIEAFDAAGNLKQIPQIAQELQDGLRGLSEEKQTQALTTIFGADAIRTASQLAQQGADGVNQALEKIAKGDAASVAAERMQGFNGAVAELQSALQGFGIALAESGLIQALTNIVKAGTAFFQLLASLPAPVQGVIATVAVLLALLGPLLIGIGQIAIGLAVLPGAAAVVGTAFAGLGGIISAVLAGLFSVPAAIGAAVVAAGYLVYRYWDQIRNAAGDLWRWIERNGARAFSFIAKAALAPVLVPLNAIVAAVNQIQRLRGKGKIDLPDFASLPGFATGGYVQGPGTGTSDSILARLSNGEGVINARAMRTLGRETLDRINAGVAPAAALGLVPTSAGSSGRPINLNIGGQTFPVSADDETAERLRRYARSEKRRSSGSVPGFAT